MDVTPQLIRGLALTLFLLVDPGAVIAQIPELPPVGGSSDPKAPPLPPPTFPPIPPAPDAPGSPRPASLGSPDAAPTQPGATAARDVELVERTLAARRAYAASLRALQDHYRTVGDERRARFAEEELRSFHRINLPVYRIELDVPSPKMRPLYNQPEANDLLRWAISYKDKGFGSDYFDNMHRAELLLQELLTKYPMSTKISEAAYLLGEVYESRVFRQPERAAAYYERCFQWNPATASDARLRAARLYDRELKDRPRAIEMYRRVLEEETVSARRLEATRRLKELGAR